MNVREATKAYESWLGNQLRIVEADLQAKHVAMADRKSSFPFLRSTFYRWAQLWPAQCPELARTATVLAVGDLHVENFGTWRDAEGRLVWGINDFDEAGPMPFAIDLVRLATSALVAIDGEHMGCSQSRACEAVLDGYVEGLSEGGAPFVLAERDSWLRKLALNQLRNPVKFWEKMHRLKPPRQEPQAEVKAALLKSAPDDVGQSVFRHRLAGLGSLGRERVTALCEWHGGWIAREAKAIVPSAWSWAHQAENGSEIWYQEIVERAIRAKDPFLAVEGNWVIRRLAPDCCRVELTDLPDDRDEEHLLHAMGKEVANVHLGSWKAIKKVKSDLKKLGTKWLRQAATKMQQATRKDWQEWRKIGKS